MRILQVGDVRLPKLRANRLQVVLKFSRLLLPAVLIIPLVGGCARYAASPLETAPASLAVPDAAILARDAATIDRPYLKPVAIDLTEPLDSNAIAIIAVLGNPDLKALRERAGIADAQAFAAGLFPDPTFSFGIDHVLSGPDPFDNIAGALGISLNALRTRAAVRAQTKAAARQVRLDLAWAEWQTAGQARIQAVRISGLEKTLALAAASRDSAQSLLDRMLRAAGRGDLAPDQLQAARLAAFDAADRLRGYERDLVAARLELLRLIGLPPDFGLRLATPTEITPVLAPDRLFGFAAKTRFDLEALKSGYDAQEAALRKAILDQFPTLDLTINGTRDTGGNRLLGPAIGFTLPLWNRNRGGIAVERATRAALKSEYSARLFQTRADIAAAIAAITVLQRQKSSLVSDLPALSRFAEAADRASRRGDLALATGETAKAALRDKQLLLAQADQAIAEQMIALELLTGAPRESWPR